MNLDTPQHAIHYAQKFSIGTGAREPERILDNSGRKAGWSFRTPAGEYGWILDDGTISTTTYGDRWWAEGTARDWINGFPLGTG